MALEDGDVDALDHHSHCHPTHHCHWPKSLDVLDVVVVVMVFFHALHHGDDDALDGHCHGVLEAMGDVPHHGDVVHARRALAFLVVLDDNLVHLLAGAMILKTPLSDEMMKKIHDVQGSPCAHSFATFAH